MTHRLQLLLIISSIFSLIYILNMVRKNKLDLKYSLAWILLGLSIIIISFVPYIIDIVSRFLSIKNTMNSLFFIASIIQLGIIFTLTISASRLSIRIKSLTQELALMKNEMYNMREEKLKN